MGNFWDFCAPFYDFAEKTNGRAYNTMLKTVHEIVPKDSFVLEIAAGTGSISIAVSDKAGEVLCTDISEKMLAIAKKKALKCGVKNITFGNLNIFDTQYPDNTFDVVVASQVFHLIEKPEKAAVELKRVAGNIVVIPMSLTEEASFAAKIGLAVYRLFGFSPKVEFAADDYMKFVKKIGFENCEFTQISGKIPMTVAVWRKKHE